MSKATISLSEWKSAIEAMIAPEEIPDGWLPAVEIMEMAGLSKANGSKVMGSLVERGLVDMRMFRVRAGRSIRPVAYYRPKDGWRRLSKLNGAHNKFGDGS